MACNLALALKKLGANVGLLDADIYGPSQPQMLEAMKPQPLINLTDKALEPIMLHGLQTMSMGNLIEMDKALIWRGPMVSSALQQLITDTKWNNLDYLIIDLPPGTGDIQLTLSQKVPVTAAIIITTPQDIALLDARRAIKMFDKVKIPTLGIIENMSMHICPECSHVLSFGKDGGKNLAEESNIALLGKCPLDLKIREETDTGTPTVEKDENHPISDNFLDIAKKVSAKISELPKVMPT